MKTTVIRSNDEEEPRWIPARGKMDIDRNDSDELILLTRLDTGLISSAVVLTKVEEIQLRFYLDKVSS